MGVSSRCCKGLLSHNSAVSLLRAREQVAPLMGGTYRYRSAWHAVNALLREHGMRGLFKGYWLTNSVRTLAALAWLHCLPATWLDDGLRVGCKSDPGPLARTIVPVHCVLVSPHKSGLGCLCLSVGVPAGQVWIPWSMLYVAAYEESKRRCAPSHCTLALSLQTCARTCSGNVHLQWACQLTRLLFTRSMPTLGSCAVAVHLHGRSRADGSAAAAVSGASGRGAPEAGTCALPAWGYAACSAGSAAAAALATQPLDVVKTRLQVPNHSAAARLLVALPMPFGRPDSSVSRKVLVSHSAHLVSKGHKPRFRSG